MTTGSVSNPSEQQPEQQDVYVFPTSFAQQRLWFLDQLEPNTAAYNISATVRINTPLDLQALEQSLQALIERHEALRTTFVARDGQPMQVVLPHLSIALSLVDLQHLPTTQREAQALRLAIAEAQQPFDLAQGPLLRTTLFKLAPEEHVLLLVVHHIIFDGGSVAVFFRELATLYQAFSTDQPPALSELPIQYVDFTMWQREWLQGEKLAEHLSYWKEQLAGAPALLELPTDRPHPSVPTNRGLRYFFSFSKQLTEGLKALSRQEGVSLYMTLMASFSTLLYRYSGQEDLLLGTVISERRRPELQELIGFFLNTLVLRTDLSGDPPFRELLRRVREVVLEAHAHQDVPFEYLVKELHPDRSLGRNPFFQVMLTLVPPRSVPPSGWALNQGWNVNQESALDQEEIKTSTAKFDLELELVERPEDLLGDLEYNADLFESATIERLVKHWQTLLEGIVAHPEQRLSELPLLTEAERHQLLVDWNATASQYPHELTIPELFEAQVERTPQALALLYQGQQLTYRELDVRATQLAHHLQQLGVRVEDRVALCVERSLDMVIGLLGILKAGGVYVPLDPAYPPERLAFMLQDAQPSVLLTQQPLLQHLPSHNQVLCLDSDWPLIAQQSTEHLVSGIRGQHLAYLLYTSGSTGHPKGVLGTHRAALNRFHWMWRTYPFAPQEVCCQKTALSFVDAVWEIFGPLLQGIRTVIIPDLLVKDPQQLLHTLAAHSVTRIVLVPSLLQRLLATAPDLGDRLPSLKYWVCSGEALPLDLALRFRQSMPHSILLNLYGSSEVAADATCYDTRNYHPSLASVPIGRPIANTQVYILDAHLQPVPIGAPGELYIGGDGLACGYFNRPELTAAKFVPNPFRSEPQARLYKTGDRARYLSDGTIEYLGRLDFQVKLRGYRIEPGEIEAVLAQHPAVRQVVVVAREDTSGDKRLVAYIVAHNGQKLTVAELQEQARRQLPSYMVPPAFVLLDALPLMPNGKVNRLALPAPESNRPELQASFAAPVQPVHEQLRQIWEDLLEVRPIGIRDNFFELGGHSLLAARLVDRIERVWNKKISLAILLAEPTIEQLANALLSPESSSTGSVPVPLQVDGSQRLVFTMHRQLTSSARTIWTKLKLRK